MKVSAQPGDRRRARESVSWVEVVLTSERPGWKLPLFESSLYLSSRLATFVLSDSSEGGAVVLPVLGGSALDARVSTTADLIVVAVVTAVAELFRLCRSQ